MKAFTIPTVFTASDRFSRTMKAMGSQMKGFANQTQLATTRVDRYMRMITNPFINLRNALNSVGFYVGLYTLIRWVRHAYDTIADFQQAQIDIAAVTGRSVQQNAALANQARIMAVRYGEAASSISQTQLNLIKLGYAGQSVMDMTEAVLTSSIALKAPPEELAKRMGAILQAFKLPSSQSQAVGDLLSKAADLSALDWSDLSTMLPTAMQSASIAFGGKTVEDNIDAFKRLLALFAMVRNAQVHVASGATGIKNMLVDAGIRGKSYQDMLQSVISSPNQLKKAWKLFGRRTLVSALPLAEAQKLGSIDDFVDKLTNLSGGYASRIASQRLDSMRGEAKRLTASYEELILALENGQGPLAHSLERIMKITRTMFYLMSGSEAAKDALSRMNPEIIGTAENWLKVLRVVGFMVKWFIILKIVIFAVRTALLVYNTALGISAALGLVSAMSLRGSSIAMSVFSVATKIATGAMWLLNAALLGSPIFWIPAAIALLGFLIYKMVKHWDEWGAAVSTFLGPIGSALSLVISLYRNWSMIVSAFRNGGILSGLKAIGKVILESWLYPFQKIYEIIHSLTGWDWALKNAKTIEGLRMGLKAWNPEGDGQQRRERVSVANQVSARRELSEGTAGPVIVDFKNVPSWIDIGGNKQGVKIHPVIGSSFGWNQGSQTSW